MRVRARRRRGCTPDPAAGQRGWDKKISESASVTARYDANGEMGGDKWYGVPNYGELKRRSTVRSLRSVPHRFCRSDSIQTSYQGLKGLNFLIISQYRGE